MYFQVIHFSSTRVSSVLHYFHEVIRVFIVFALVYIVTTVLIRLWFFLFLGFVSANFQVELIVWDKFSSLLVLFLSFSFFSSFSFYQRKPKSIYSYLDTNAHADTQTYRIRSCKNKLPCRPTHFIHSLGQSNSETPF